METTRCSLNPAHQATCFCRCTPSPTPLCGDCLPIHSQTHLQASGPSAICDACNSAFAACFCCCKFPVTRMCEGCKMLHMGKDGQGTHSLLPIAEIDRASSREGVTMLRRVLVDLDTAVDSLQAHIDRITECQGKLHLSLATARDSLENFYGREHAKLEAVKLAIAQSKGTISARIRAQQLAPNLPGDHLAEVISRTIETGSFSTFEVFAPKDVKPQYDFSATTMVEWVSQVDREGRVCTEGKEWCHQNEVRAIAGKLLERDYQSYEELLMASSREIQTRGVEVAVESPVSCYLKHFFVAQKASAEVLRGSPDLSQKKSVWVDQRKHRFLSECSSIPGIEASAFLLNFEQAAAALYDSASNKSSNNLLSSQLHSATTENNKLKDKITHLEEKYLFESQYTFGLPLSAICALLLLLLLAGIGLRNDSGCTSPSNALINYIILCLFGKAVSFTEQKVIDSISLQSVLRCIGIAVKGCWVYLAVEKLHEICSLWVQLGVIAIALLVGFEASKSFGVRN